MIEFLNNLDTTVFLAINGAHSPFFDSFMTMFSGRFVWIPMYAMVLWILFRSCRPQTAVIYLLALVAAIFLTDQTCASLIRPAVERLRPSNLENELSQWAYVVDNYRGGSYGFPSCHAANSFALALFLSLFVKRRGFTFFIIGWALLNSYSRLYLGVHYPGDLLVGASIGAVFGVLCYLLASRIEGHRSRGFREERLSRPLFTRFFDIESTSSQPGSLPRLRLTLSDLMIAAFAATVAVITIASALALA